MGGVLAVVKLQLLVLELFEPFVLERGMLLVLEPCAPSLLERSTVKS